MEFHFLPAHRLAFVSEAHGNDETHQPLQVVLINCIQGWTILAILQHFLAVQKLP